MVNEKQHPAPWTFEPAENGNCNVIRDAAGESIMGDEDYYPWVNMTEDEWKMVAASPRLLKVAQAFLSFMARFGNWDDGCFYYNGTTASELEKPIQEAEAALVAAGVKFAG